MTNGRIRVAIAGAGMVTGGPAAISKSDRQNFANRLDQLLARRDNR